MSRRRSRSTFAFMLAFLLTFLLMSATLSAAAVAQAAIAPQCHIAVALDLGTLTPTWQSAIESLERELNVAPETTCHGVELTLTAAPGGVRVSAGAPDKRSATRLVTDPSALSAVVFGVLAMAPSEPEPQPDDPLDFPPPPDPAAEKPRPVAPFDEPLRVSVSAASGVRQGFPTTVTMMDVEVRADVLVHKWLLTLNMRATPLGVSPRLAWDDDAYDEAAIGLGFGRELRLGRSAFDLTAGPNLTYIWMESDALNLDTEHAQLRVAAALRWGYAVTSRLRLNVTVDGEVAPSGLAHTGYEPGLAPFPAFTLGLRIGAEAAL